MFKNFWYAIQHGSKVTAEPSKLRVMGQDLVLWRNESGEPVVQSDICVHRGGSLAGGWVERGANGHSCVVCPYHGWEYDDSGACVKIPAAGPEAKIPGKARTDTYPSLERYGFVWAFLGDLSAQERPPMPELPGLEQAAEAFRRLPDGRGRVRLERQHRTRHRERRRHRSRSLRARGELRKSRPPGGTRPRDRGGLEHRR
ncbi:MAG: Rieske (2Fe-2S) protein [Microthrixaceae bacterium]